MKKLTHVSSSSFILHSGLLIITFCHIYKIQRDIQKDIIYREISYISYIHHMYRDIIHVYIYTLLLYIHYIYIYKLLLKIPMYTVLMSFLYILLQSFSRIQCLSSHVSFYYICGYCACFIINGLIVSISSDSLFFNSN